MSPRSQHKRRADDRPLPRELRRLAWSLLFFLAAGAAYAALWAVGLFH